MRVAKNTVSNAINVDMSIGFVKRTIAPANGCTFSLAITSPLTGSGGGLKLKK